MDSLLGGSDWSGDVSRPLISEYSRAQLWARSSTYRKSDQKAKSWLLPKEYGRPPTPSLPRVDRSRSCAFHGLQRAAAFN